MMNAYRNCRFFLLTLLCLMTSLVAVPAFAQVLQAVHVEGNQRVEESTVRSYLGLTTGEKIQRSDLDRSLKALFATGLFADVVLEQKGSDLYVKVVENPVVNQIVFEGNDKLSREDLYTEISMRPRQVFTRSKVQADVARLYQIYRRSGRFAANIEPKAIQLDQNRVDLVFEIDEGDVSDVEAIRFVGNKAFTNAELRSAITTKQSAWWRFITNSDRYDPDRLAFDQDQVRQFYLKKGYADFELISAIAELSDDRDAFFITFTVDEGQRYKVAETSIDSQIKAVDLDLLKDSLTFETGDWYSSDDVRRSVGAITDALGDQQYAFVNVRPQIERNREAAELDVVFKVLESPRVFIERIDVSGNVRTLDKVIRREMLLVEGDPFNKTKLAESERKIRNLDFFESIAFDVRPGSAPDKTIIDIRVVEKSTGEISLGAGFSTSDGLLSDVGIRERNLLGRGQDLKLSALVSADRTRFDIGFTEPAFLDRDISAGVNLFSRELQEQESRRFDERRTGGRLFMGYPLSKNWRQTLSYRLDQAEISNLPSDAGLFLLQQEGELTTSAISQRVTYDTRDSIQNPRSGMNFWLETELAGLGFDSKHISGQTGISTYYGLTDTLTLNLLAETGAITGYGGEDVTVTERFTLGGPNSFRGFEQFGLGARDLATLDDGGGNIFYRGTAEVSFPFPYLSQHGVRGAVFSDVGALYDVDQDVAGVGDENSLRMSAGLGISWNSPFGPIGIYYAEPFIKEDFDQVKEFEFSFGTNF